MLCVLWLSLDGDEEYASWRKSVLSSRNNVAMVAEEASKPPKSLSKFNMDSKSCPNTVIAW